MEIPSFFICPISLQIMKDPVTVITGITYDRKSIEKWFFSYHHYTCPVTKLPLKDQSLIPNSTLFRLIRSWCIANRPSEEVLTPKPPVDASAICELLNEAKIPQLALKSLDTIFSLIGASERNRRCFEENAGTARTMASLINNELNDPRAGVEGVDVDGVVGVESSGKELELAMGILQLLHVPPEELKRMGEERSGRLIETLSWLLQRGSYRAKVRAAMLLKSILQEVDTCYLTTIRAELFDGAAEILKDQNSSQATTMAVLQILVEVCGRGRGRNCNKAVEAGVVAVLVELLAEKKEKRGCEMMLAALEAVCGHAEGRAALVSHPLGIASVARKILRVSQVANEKAVKVLWLLAGRFSASDDGILQEMIEVGAVTKLVMVMQGAESTRNTGKKAREILRLNWGTWRRSPCAPTHLLSSSSSPSHHSCLSLWDSGLRP
ncbi:E3 ubiquitin-protein ligase PUB23 [Amborella trichopoda]|uniref:U-box domain-containing protein n=1 Tax=Amborella trichopoda TaxID=13333 RepID=U5DFU2_AMBTC|nr:E3 ubiquitin-protein ligase PUB23 [Amborella trichopoda]ERN19298.1 hypothetical protein AMTR_s00069p00038840 [Amborella trichopoda]|eukprot:XP_006857831.1 E3 ubiquitin-protein ligase PUB23 [Amborella trichopoda]